MISQNNFRQSTYELSNNKKIHYEEYFDEKIVCQAWPSSLYFMELTLHFPEIVCSKNVLDLGCGIGLAGIVRLCQKLPIYFQRLH